MKPNELKAYLQNKMKLALAQSMTAIANEAKNWTLDRFNKENWIDTSAQKWPLRNRRAKRNIGRKLLVDTGRLKRSIRVFSTGATGFKYGTDVKYASIHNYGETINRNARSELIVRNRGTRGRFRKGATRGRGFSFRSGSFDMPQRQYLGNSRHLRGLLSRRAKVEIIRRMRA